MGFLGTFIIYSLILDAIHVLVFVSQKFFSQGTTAEIDSVRRKFILGSASWGVFTGAVATTALGFNTARNGLQVKKIKIPIKDLPQDLSHLKIVQISDVHIGLTIDESYIRRMVDQIMQLNADIIAITGDMVDGSPENLAARWAPLRELKARLGIYFVTGNHEYYSGALDWLKTTEELGFINLINENKIITENNSQILIAGVTDPTGANFYDDHAPDMQSARGQDQECHLKILLAHRPEASDEAAQAGFDLQLSGHTHAGQFFPFNLIVMFAHKYYKGLNRHENMWVYVNQGTGYWGPANRFALPPEISLFSFEPKSEPS